ncbi:hypothetical protein SAMN02799622_05348 [Methylobacterium sp. UNC378MF]|uniref:hypothetical protein n=1 Tax=Methylobacterium sp. UNC378MF TaxID=1502748 RepID=UPI0008882613|nr:hypothetical protein [Methylobacterium sp. UNC378MF]SDA32881.1 hypothetical protein SAMN02799622_05348 [Methylobacterium sp. UNC378MF]
MRRKSQKIAVLCLCVAGLSGIGAASAEEGLEEPSFDLRKLWPFTLLAGPSPEVEREARTQAKVRWLDTHRLTSELGRQEDWPLAAETCEAKNLRMTERPQLTLPETVAEAFRRKEQRPWSFIRYDVEAKGIASGVAAIDSSGDPDFDAAAAAAMISARFELLNGTDRAKGCIAYFAGTDFVGTAPVQPSENREAAAVPRPLTPRRRPKAIQPSGTPDTSPLQGATTEDNSSPTKRWWYRDARDQSGSASRTAPPEGITCATLADRLARPAQCER